MKIYLAGPMRGIPHLNYPAFAAARTKLRAGGHEVFCPAEHSLKQHGQEFADGNFDGCARQAERDYGFSLRRTLGEDLAWLCAHAEAIALLPGWERSLGAPAEHAAALALGLDKIYLDATGSEKT